MSRELLFSPRVQSHLHATYLLDQHATGAVRDKEQHAAKTRVLREATNGTWKNLTDPEREYVRERFDGELERVRVSGRTRKTVFIAPGMRVDLEIA